ncbi:alanine racemase [Promicromonospora sp. Populi]|uniref:alanine racemase n=1 Tax=Promicromonospora sp. Populi TaxID=3239420 RepID=UPI0034E2DC6C
MSTTPAYPARAVVDLDAIRDNVRALRAIAPTAQVMAVVKADAYGHGLAPVARAALAGGATWLGAAQNVEALAVRAAVGPGPRILTWLSAPGAPFAELVRADVDIAIAAAWALDEVADGARAAGGTARVHLKVDSGLGRNGITPEDLPAVLDRAVALQHEGALAVVGVMSHYAIADEPDDPSVKMQTHAFEEAIRTVEAAGLPIEVRHIANSAATLTNPAAHYDLVRPGIAVYGLSPVPHLGVPSDYGLRPAMTLEARLATVKRVPAGHGVSYGHFYITTQDTVLGVIPLGYADGIPRHASGGSLGPGGPVLVGGGVDDVAAPGTGLGTARVLRVVGRVCMDQIMLDLGPYAPEQAGDVVTLFGASDGLARAGAPSAEDWAQAAGTISYEIVTRLGARVPRVYAGTAGRETA